jgi:hypothetical protein
MSQNNVRNNLHRKEKEEKKKKKKGRLYHAGLLRCCVPARSRSLQHSTAALLSPFALPLTVCPLQLCRLLYTSLPSAFMRIAVLPVCRLHYYSHALSLPVFCHACTYLLHIYT